MAKTKEWRPFHPLISQRFGKKVTELMSSSPSPDADFAFDEAVLATIATYDEATAAAALSIAEARRTMEAAHRQRIDALNQEVEALRQMVVADYDRVLGPLVDYGMKLRDERDALLASIAAEIVALTADQEAAHARLKRELGELLQGYRSALFYGGKQALNAALAGYREQLRAIA